MKFNLFLLLLTIFAVVAFAYPNNYRTGTDLLKRGRPNPRCSFISCCNSDDAKCKEDCPSLSICSCNPKASCCRDNDETCKNVCKLRICEPKEPPVIGN